ncbi:MAG TPA: BglII/BstYI family type II restriction endonuclease [Capsulimonadaceae bacterium]|nr:BglII/BstYI family type II restriction endonuclease [Capsulimonadaceae bacterium]
MDIARTYSYRHAEAILRHEFSSEMAEIEEAVAAVQWVPIIPPRPRIRNGRTVAVIAINQAQTNLRFEAEFEARGWQKHPYIVSEADSRLAADFKKNRIQVEVQFGNMARWYTDVFKFLLSYSANDIEIGVLIVPMQITAKQIDENVVYFERVVRELPHAKMAVTIPVWVVGINGGIAPEAAAAVADPDSNAPDAPE